MSEKKENSYKWLLGPLIGIILALLGGAVAYGATTANVQDTSTEVTQVETKLDAHVKDNQNAHDGLKDKMSKQDVANAKRETLLLGIDKKLDEMHGDLKEHLKGHK